MDTKKILSITIFALFIGGVLVVAQNQTGTRSYPTIGGQWIDGKWVSYYSSPFSQRNQQRNQVTVPQSPPLCPCNTCQNPSNSTPVIIDPVVQNEMTRIDNLLDTSFTLWGQTWLVGKGDNDRIYATVSNSVPTHLVKVTFPGQYERSGGDIIMEYAIFTGHNFKSTGHLINEAVRQFRDNRISIPYNAWLAHMAADRDTLMSIARRGVADTLWTCSGSKLETALSPTGAIVRDRKFYWHDPNTQEEVERSLLYDDKDTIWHTERPYGFIETVFDESSKTVFTEEREFDSVVTRWYKPMDINQDADFVDYCDPARNTCREHIACDAYKVPEADYWQLHLFPVVKWFPRDIRTGMPKLEHDWLSMGMAQARKMRKISIEHIKYLDVMYDFQGDSVIHADTVGRYLNDSTFLLRNRNLHEYRAPYFSDSASCVLSVQFLSHGSQVSGQHSDVISTKISIGTDEDFAQGFYIDRLPNRMIKIASASELSIESAILRLYVDDNGEDEFMRETRTRCGENWRNDDVTIGEQYRFPATRNTSFWYGGTTDSLILDTETYSDKKYKYDGCPALPIPEFEERGFTASDLRTFVYRTPPLCDVPAMTNALAVLLKARPYMTNADDLNMINRRIVQLGDALEKRKDATRGVPEDRLALMMALCPDTWESYFRDSVGMSGENIIWQRDNNYVELYTVEKIRDSLYGSVTVPKSMLATVWERLKSWLGVEK